MSKLFKSMSCPICNCSKVIKTEDTYQCKECGQILAMRQILFTIDTDKESMDIENKNKPNQE